jgi:hypothetical protein
VELVAEIDGGGRFRGPAGDAPGVPAGSVIQIELTFVDWGHKRSRRHGADAGPRNWQNRDRVAMSLHARRTARNQRDAAMPDRFLILLGHCGGRTRDPHSRSPIDP